VCACAIEFDELGGRGFEENNIFYNFLVPNNFFLFLSRNCFNIKYTEKKPFYFFKNAFLFY